MADTLTRARPCLPRESASNGVEALCNALHDWGAVVVEQALPEADIVRIRDAMAPWFERTPPGEGHFLGKNTRRFSGVFAKAPATAQLAIHPVVLETVERMLIGDAVKRCDNIQLNLTQAIAIDPGQGAQPIHRDESMFPFAHDYEVIVNVMWPLDDFTPENGATKIALQSHFWPRERRPFEHELTNAKAPLGSAIMWLGGTLHGGGANMSAAPRRGVVFNYCLGWLAQAEKLLLSTPPHIARRLPNRLQRLIGYQVHRPSLGWIEERDPIEWLRGEFSDIAAAQDHFTPDLETRLTALVEATS